MKRYYLFLLPLLGFLFSYQSPTTNTQAEIAAAQSWFQNSSYANTIFLGNALQPDWSQAQVSKPKADRLIIDVPLVGGGQSNMGIKNPQTGLVSPADQNGATRLVITKFSDNSYSPMLFHVFAAPAYINQFGAQAVGQVKPHQIQSNFSGYLFYTKLSGELFYGIKVENGQLTSTMTPIQQNAVIPRNCTTVETICMEYFGYTLCVNFVLCEVFDGPGGIYFVIDNGNSWWGNGPVIECFDCTGGGFFPPICPDGSPMSVSGDCGDTTEPPGICQLTNQYVLASGPFVIEFFVAGFIPYPWEAWTNIAGKLTDCENGHAAFETIISEQTGGVHLGNTDVFITGTENFLYSKTWGISTHNFAQFIFEIQVFDLTFSSSASDENTAYFPMKYN